jgi:hypothetical protein
LKYKVERADVDSREYILARMHASAQGRCEYSGYYLGWSPEKAGGGGPVEQEVEVDHRVEIHFFEVLMTCASKALAGAARAYHLPWSAGAQAWVYRKANSLTNLAAVNADAHARKTALGSGFIKAVQVALGSEKVALPYVEAHYHARLLAQRGGKAGVGALRATYAAELANTYVLLSLEMLRELPSEDEAEGEYGVLLCEWLARVLGALGGLRGDPGALAPKQLAFEGKGGAAAAAGGQ